MRLPMILSWYIGRQFILSVLCVLLIMLLIIGMVEMIEQLRRAADAPRPVPFLIVLELMLLRLPATAEKVYPFTFLIGGMVTLSRLTRTSELVVARAAGVSVWQFLMPGIFAALVMGVMFVGIMNPIAAATTARFDRVEAKYITGSVSVFSISPSGLWLRQVDEDGIYFKDQTADEYIIHALRMDQRMLTMDHVIVFLSYHNKFIGRIDAEKAELKPGKWVISNAILSQQGSVPETVAHFEMPTQLTITQIQDSFSAPETFSFWELPGFIEVLEKAGFSALRHKLHYYSLMAMPALFAGMVVMAAVFTLRQPRRGRTGMLVVAGMVTGFIFYFITNLIYAMGASGSLPVLLAAWAPSLIVLMIANAALLHMEDG